MIYLCDMWTIFVALTAFFYFFGYFYAVSKTNIKQEKYVMDNQTLEAFLHIKNISRKSPTVNLSFVNDNVKHLFAKNKIDDNFKIVEKT